MAYPVYLTIGNIPKNIRRKPSRRAQLLIGYIPTTNFEGVRSKTGRSRAQANLFHTCMQSLLEPIKSCGEMGVPMMGADKIWRRCHPILAVFIGDYPEQALVTCTYNGRCSKCEVANDRLGDLLDFPSRDPSSAIEIYRLADDDAHAFHKACRNAGLKPVFHPFWESLPLSNIFLSITPDILHQLLQGVMKRLIGWLTSPTIFGSAEIDLRCKLLPPNHGITTFTKGLTAFSRISGQEHKNMCRVLLGLILDLPLPSGQVPSRVIKATRALLDFLYLAQYPSHTMETLQCLYNSLARFHENKTVFIDLGTRKDFNIPKLHSLMHYATSILLFGTTDNYNTEQTERLHIDLAKNAYRATNHKDEYMQMSTWLERREKVHHHAAFLKRQQESGSVPLGRDGQTPTSPSRWHHPVREFRFGHLKMPQSPTIKAVSFLDIDRKYHANNFQDDLADFIVKVNYPGASTAALRARAEDTLIPFHAVPVFHRIRFVDNNDCDEQETVDAVHVRPEVVDLHGQVVPARFDIVLVRTGQDRAHTSNKGKLSYQCMDQSNCFPGCQIAQVRIVFQIPSRIYDDVFPSPDITPPTHLAYVEWFSPIPATPDPIHKMYKVSRSRPNEQRRTGIIPVESILGSVHLFPHFGPSTPQRTSFTVLEDSTSFFINPFANMRSYFMFSS